METAPSRFSLRAIGAGVANALLVAAPAVAQGAPEPREMVAPLPLQANLLPDPETLPLPGERKLLDSLLTKMTSGEVSDAGAAMPHLDGTLDKLNEPTKLRGFVQYIRAGALHELSREGEAIEAIEESIRLLPSYSGPLLAAASIYAFNNQPQIGADYLLRASRIDPVSVRSFDDYEIDNVLRRLAVVRDERRVRALSDRLLEINWVGRRLGNQSTLAVSAIERRISEGDVAGARALIPKLLVPEHSASLLMERAYSELWREVERWAGARFEKQWPLYLAEARERWLASRDVLALSDYVTALASAGHDKTIIRDVLPVFSRRLSPRQDHELLFVAAPAARALAREGRWKEADKLYESVLRVWPLGSHANALNAAANRARHLLFADQPQKALDLMDASIADARKWGSINLDAMAAMHHYRACMLHELGRASEAASSIGYAVRVETPSAVAYLQLCMGNKAAARTALLNGLKYEQTRDDVIEFMQLPGARPMPSAYGQRLHAASEELRRDPELMKAIEPYGRILPFAINAAAPAEKL